MFVPELEVKIWVKTPPGAEGHTKGSQTLPAAFIFWVGFLHKDKAPRTKSGLGAKDCAQKSAGNASPTPYGFTPKAHGILWGFTASPSFWDSLHAPIHSNLPKAHQATKYLCFFSVLGVFLAPHWAHCHSRNYQLIFPTRNGPETDAAALGRAKHCDKQGQCQQLYLKHAPELGVWDTFLAAPIQLCPSSQSTSHLSHLDHVNKENSEVYQVFPTTGLRSQVPDILEPELNSFPWPNPFPLATSILMFAEMFNYYEKWNFNRASDDSKKQLVVLNAVLCRDLSISPVLIPVSINVCREHLHRAAVWATFLLATQVLFSLREQEADKELSVCLILLLSPLQSIYSSLLTEKVRPEFVCKM